MEAKGKTKDGCGDLSPFFTDEMRTRKSQSVTPTLFGVKAKTQEEGEVLCKM